MVLGISVLRMMHACVLSCFSRVQLFVTLWAVVHQACPWDSAGKNTGVVCPGPPPGDLPDLGTEPESPALQEDSLPLSHPGSPL